MRGRERIASGRERKNTASGVVRFSSDQLPEADRLTLWREVIGKTLTGCAPSPIEGGAFRADFSLVGGSHLRVGVCDLSHIRNNRDRDCLRDHDDDFVLFSMLHGRGTVEHNDQRTLLRPGDAVLCKFDRTTDTHWPDGRLMVIRIAQDQLRAHAPEKAIGNLQPRSRTVMRLLQTYARTAWREALRTGTLEPIAERHMAELIGALCATNADDAAAAARPAVGAVRTAAMREVIARHYANPCLTMRDVAASVGLSERAGYLAFEAARLNFTDELYAVRLDRAREMLRGGSARVIDIAYGVGFSDASHFHRLFKQRFGCTPGEMRYDS